MVGEATSFGAKDSIWWRDVVSVGESIMAGWFKSNFSCVVGNGTDISFWNVKWCGNNSFGELFPNLFTKELRQNSLIADKMINNREGLSWRWE
ncbi:putative ribonuclease H protein [Trifolium medium]|uniref:Putative ribonuclease H protein n=1 Tax=Trifolium medium TaxID=97028 RepID=A0A392QUX7_9FABA|nr:putative ribonuclease H protein [Trifolium medium]